jgi:hypothetical protein
MKNILSTLIGLIILCSSALAQINSNGLVGYWPFNGNATDGSGNRNNGIVNGAQLTADRFGNPNSAYKFNGINSSIVIPLSTSTTFFSNISISFWAKLNAAQSGILLHARNQSNAHETSITSNILGQQNDHFRLNNGESGASLKIPSIENPDLNYHHFVCVFNVSTNTTSFYVDNVLQGVSNQGITILGPSTISIGAAFYDAGKFNQFFTGIIDDIRIYNRALSTTEISALYTENSNLVKVESSDYSGKYYKVMDGNLDGQVPSMAKGNASGTTMLTLVKIDETHYVGKTYQGGNALFTITKSNGKTFFTATESTLGRSSVVCGTAEDNRFIGIFVDSSGGKGDVIWIKQ